MKVKDLIEVLNRIDGEAEVKLRVGLWDWENVESSTDWMSFQDRTRR